MKKIRNEECQKLSVPYSILCYMFLHILYVFTDHVLLLANIQCFHWQNVFKYVLGPLGMAKAPKPKL